MRSFFLPCRSARSFAGLLLVLFASFVRPHFELATSIEIAGVRMWPACYFYGIVAGKEAQRGLVVTVVWSMMFLFLDFYRERSEIFAHSCQLPVVVVFQLLVYYDMFLRRTTVVSFVLRSPHILSNVWGHPHLFSWPMSLTS